MTNDRGGDPFGMAVLLTPVSILCWVALFWMARTVVQG